MSLRPLTPIEARVLATLMEKARTVPDTYPLSLNGVVTGCNQKTSREPVMNVGEGQAQEALDDLRALSLSMNRTAAGSPSTSTTFSASTACPSNRRCCWAC